MAEFDGGRYGRGLKPRPGKTQDPQPLQKPEPKQKIDGKQAQFDPTNPQLLKINKGLLTPTESVSEKEKREQAEAILTGAGKLGEASLSAEDFVKLAPLSAAQHILMRLADGRGRLTRAAIIEQNGDLIRAIDDPTKVTQLFSELRGGGGIVDLHLSLLHHVVRKSPALLPKIRPGRLAHNFEALTEVARGKGHEVGETVTIELPLGLKVTGFALQDGGSPGFCLSPGELKNYELEFWGPGEFKILLFGEMRGLGYIDDQLSFKIVGAPEDP